MSKQSKPLSFRPAAPDELQIDLDRPRARISKRLLRLVSEHVQIKSVKYQRSRSGNTHATLKLKMLELPGWRKESILFERAVLLEKLFLQAALGSDPVRELLSWGRARNGCPYPTLFFEEAKVKK